MARDYKYARDKDGKIMKDHKGRPMLASHFVNEPDSLEYFDEGMAKSTREFFEKELSEGRYVPEDCLLREGFKKVGSKWVWVGK